MATTAAPAPTQTLEDSRTAALAAQQWLKERLAPSTSTGPDITALPIIDLTPSFSSSLSARQAVAKEIHDACTTIGFFYIVGHGIPSSVLEATLDLAKRFFHEVPQESKEKIHIRNSAHFRGYEPADSSTVNGLDGEEGGPETKQGFNWGYESGLDPSGGDGKYVELDGTPEGKVNMWPDENEVPGFYDGIKQYYGRVLDLSRHLFRLFALSLELPETYFDPMVTHPGGIARMIRYPPATHPAPMPSSNDEIGLGAHTDYECFTLLLQSSVPGLEVLSPTGKWIQAKPVQDGIVVNIADFLMRWSNGRYKSTVHRVVNRTDQERYSIPLFFSINYDETVTTLPSCLKEGEEEKFKPITAGKYVLDRLALTFGWEKY